MKPSLIIAALVLLTAWWAVDVDLPREARVPDPAVERAYADCFAERDEALHEQAFATIDNPDVQREFINTERDAARAACRAAHPQRLVTVSQPLEIRLFGRPLRQEHVKR